MSETIFIVDGLRMCGSCLDGDGGFCNNPGCAFCRSTAPDIPIRKTIELCGGSVRPEILTPEYPRQDRMKGVK